MTLAVTTPTQAPSHTASLPAPQRISRPRSRGLRAARWLLLGAALFVVGFGLIYADVRRQGGPVLSDATQAPRMPVAIIFGAGYSKYGLSPILQDRVLTGVELYKAGKVRKLLMTGDNGHLTHNEPEAMRLAAIQFGVPARDIVLDYAGFRTYDSLYRARDIFGVRQAVLVTQAYHLPRALYLGHALGLDVVGVAADRRDYGRSMRRFVLREILATENAWVETHFLHPRPTFLGKKEPIFP